MQNLFCYKDYFALLKESINELPTNLFMSGTSNVLDENVPLLQSYLEKIDIGGEKYVHSI